MEFFHIILLIEKDFKVKTSPKLWSCLFWRFGNIQLSLEQMLYFAPVIYQLLWPEFTYKIK